MIAPLPYGPYEVIAADPPWAFKTRSGKGKGRSAEKHYPTMGLADIAAIPVADIAAKDAFLFFWITGPLFVQGAHIPIMTAWGFTPSAVAFVWAKTNKGANDLIAESVKAGDPDPLSLTGLFFRGMGYTTRQNAEYCLIGRRGNPRRVGKSVPQIITEARREHSRKPEAFYSRVLDFAGPGVRRLEMFARTPRPLWDAWGNETEKFAEAAE